MNKSIFKILRAAILSIIVALLIVFLIIGISIKVFKDKIDMAIYLFDIVTIKSENVEKVKPELKENILINYPTYGSKYADLKIDSIDLNLPVYYGANYEILKSGIAHDETSFFPGEGGSIIFAGHNFKSFLANLPKVNINEKILVDTSYGKFYYKVYDTKIVKETDTKSVPVQQDKEILMIYTCWPINNIGHAEERYVVYAEKIEEE